MVKQLFGCYGHGCLGNTVGCGQDGSRVVSEAEVVGVELGELPVIALVVPDLGGSQGEVGGPALGQLEGGEGWGRLSLQTTTVGSKQTPLQKKCHLLNLLNQFWFSCQKLSYMEGLGVIYSHTTLALIMSRRAQTWETGRQVQR